MSAYFNETSLELHEKWMRLALRRAEEAAHNDEVPVGAVLVDTKSLGLIASGNNRPISQKDPTGHAEIVVLRQASLSRNNYRLPETVLYVTIEPCTMCVLSLIHI